MKRALVVLNGDPPSKGLLRRLARQADLVVAADGGANICRRHGVAPDVIVGDLDSIRPAVRRHFGRARIVKRREQDSTDFEKAFEFLRRKKVSDVEITGIEGKRIDFTLGNFISLWRYVPEFRCSIFGEGWFAAPVTGRLDLSLPVGTLVSLLPFSRCTHVTLSGFRYPLKGATLDYGSLGVSNVTTRGRNSVAVRKGKLLVVAFPK